MPKNRRIVEAPDGIVHIESLLRERAAKALNDKFVVGAQLEGVSVEVLIKYPSVVLTRLEASELAFQLLEAIRYHELMNMKEEGEDDDDNHGV